MEINSIDDVRVMKVPELRKLAKDYGLVGYSKMKKLDMVTSLTDKLSKLTAEDKPPSPPPSPPAEEEKPKKKRSTKKKQETQPIVTGKHN